MDKGLGQNQLNERVAASGPLQIIQDPVLKALDADERDPGVMTGDEGRETELEMMA